ncbi:MAG: dTDP-4-dehydrorhamnose 3,5-epimerase family protein [Candidatus Promineifilaceae bacterium]
MTTIIDLEEIEGVQVAQIRAFADDRGRFLETFRKEWFPQRAWEELQCNRSDSQANVLRGLHYHFHQIDYWYVMAGSMRVALVDIRRQSPTYLNSYVIEMGEPHDRGLYIPSGVAHGFVAVTSVTLTYTVDKYFDGGKDEFGVAWNDPAFNLNWGVQEPILSGRDLANPLLRDIDPRFLP